MRRKMRSKRTRRRNDGDRAYQCEHRRMPGYLRQPHLVRLFFLAVLLRMLFLNHYCSYHKSTVITLLVCSMLYLKAGAQSGSALRLSLEDLYSTHGNHFQGISASYHRHFGKKWELGAGIEYTYTPHHDDNGWNLYHLGFVPVYLSEYFYIGRFNRWRPYVHMQEGISFARYDKEFQDRPGTRYPIRERGFYGYGGAGVYYKASPASGFFLEPGMKAFHLSFNNLDVNPHGFALKLGYVYRLK